MRSHFLDLSIDPIEELISMQLASLSFEGIYTFRRSRNQISPSSTSKVCSTNSIEDMFIEAIDKKYHKKARSSDIVVSMLVSGLTIEDVASLLAINTRTVRRISMEIEEELEDGTD